MNKLQIEQHFHSCVKSLFERKCYLQDQINKWSDNHIEQVRSYVEKQRNLIEETHKKLLDELKVKEDEMKSKVVEIKEQNSEEALKRLLDNCSILKSQLGELQLVVVQFKTIKFVPENTNSTATVIIEHKNSNSERQNDSSAQQKPISDSSTQTDELIVENKESQLKIDEKIKITKHEENHKETLIENCPLCFMLFQTSMTLFDRNRHIDGHC